MKKIIFSTFLLMSLVAISCEDDEATVEAPTARFTYTVDENNGLLVNFTNASLNADSYSWDFGDGETSPKSQLYESAFHCNGWGNMAGRISRG